MMKLMWGFAPHFLDVIVWCCHFESKQLCGRFQWNWKLLCDAYVIEATGTMAMLNFHVRSWLLNEAVG